MSASDGDNPLYQRIRVEIERQIPAFRSALNSGFRLSTHELNAYPERAVSYYFIRAIADSIDNARVLLEVPIENDQSKKRDNHIDALIFNETTVVLAEFKRSWSPSHWSDLAKDVDRIRRVQGEIAQRFEDGKKRSFYGFYGADTWLYRNAEGWPTAATSSRGWSIPTSLAKPYRWIHEVFRVEGGRKKNTDWDGHYLLCAIESLPPEEGGSTGR